MCSKSSLLRTLSVPPRLPPVSDSLAGVWTPCGIPRPVAADFGLLDPQAASASANSTASAASAIIRIDFIVAPPLVELLVGRPDDGAVCDNRSFGGLWIEGIVQAVAEQVEGQHCEQQG